jgi:Cd2+/Zn2+-exporting ATPase
MTLDTLQKQENNIQEDACACEGTTGCGCELGHAHAQPETLKPFVARLAVAFSITLIVALADFPGIVSIVGYGAAYLLAGYEVLLYAGKNILKGQLFDENFLMSLASLAAFVTGDMPEAIAVMIFYGVGEVLEDMAVSKSRGNIAALMDIRPDYANLMDESEIRRVSPETVRVGQIIVVRPGEKIPLDGIVLRGESFVDTKALTGEPVPKHVTEDSLVLSGSVNQNGL